MPSPTRSRMTPERQAEVFDAVMDIVREVGYERLTFDAVAVRARTSKATLYRLWEDKAGLVVSALRAREPRPPFAPGATLAEDLATLERRRRPDRIELELMIGLTRAAVVDPQFGETVRRVMVAPALEELTTIFERAAGRGEIRDEPELFRQIAIGMVSTFLFTRLLGEPADDPVADYLQHLVMPALTFLDVRR